MLCLQCFCFVFMTPIHQWLCTSMVHNSVVNMMEVNKSRYWMEIWHSNNTQMDPLKDHRPLQFMQLLVFMLLLTLALASIPSRLQTSGWSSQGPSVQCEIRIVIRVALYVYSVFMFLVSHFLASEIWYDYS